MMSIPGAKVDSLKAGDLCMTTKVRKTVPIVVPEEPKPTAFWTNPPPEHLVALSEETAASITAHATKEVKRAKQPPAQKETIVQGDKQKLFNLAILIEWPKLTSEMWRNCLFAMQFGLQRDYIKQIVDAWPDEDSQKRIADFHDDGRSLEVVDRFFIDLRDIPTLKNKFEAFDYSLRFAARVKWIRHEISSAMSGSAQLLNADLFPAALAYIHGYIHFLNTGKRITQADRVKGFHVEMLQKILETHSFKDRASFVELIAIDIERDHPNVAAFFSQLSELELLARVSESAIKSEFRSLQAGLINITDEWTNSEAPIGISNATLIAQLAIYHLIIGAFRQDATRELEELGAQVAEFQTAIGSLKEYIGESPTKELSEAVGPIHNFVQAYAAARKKFLIPVASKSRFDTSGTNDTQEQVAGQTSATENAALNRDGGTKDSMVAANTAKSAIKGVDGTGGFGLKGDRVDVSNNSDSDDDFELPIDDDPLSFFIS